MAFWWLCATVLLAFPCEAWITVRFKEQPPDSPEVMDATLIAMTLFNKKAKDEFYALEKVISAKTLDMKGVMFKLEVEVQRCEKQNEQMTSCPQDSNTKRLLCHFQLFEKIWKSGYALLESQCRDP